jgi:hypothetical protein
MSGGRNDPVRRNRGLGDVLGGQPGGVGSLRGLVLIINAMLIGVGGVFVATASVLVTTIAALSALALVVVILMADR